MAREHHQPDRFGGHARPFDVESDEVTEQFWGRTRGWASRPEQRHDAADRTAELDRVGDEIWAERTGSMRAVRSDGADRVAAARRAAAGRRGGVDRTRSHGIVRPGAPRPDDRTDQLAATVPGAVPGTHRRDDRSARHEATLGQLAAGTDHRDAGAWDDAAHEWDAELVLDERRRNPRGVAPLAERLGLGAVDPLLLRIGVLVLTGALAVPFAMGLRDDDGGLATADAPVAAAAGVAPAVTAPVVVTATPATSPANPTAVPAAAPASEPEPATTGADDDASAPAGESAPAAGSSDESEAESGDADATDANDANDAVADDGIDEAATVTATAQRLEPECALEYVAAPGDSWYRIADAAGITPDELLDANLADVDAPIFPGDEICLPAGATMPTPPTTTTPPTTAPPTTVAPSTTAAPSTTKPPSTSAPASTTEVQRLIREIWPDELEEKALDVAWRESNYRATAFNGTCCHGVFQIHWTAHRSWLDDFGITSTSDLYDARKNITAAYALYQRAGGWGPWGG